MKGKQLSLFDEPDTYVMDIDHTISQPVWDEENKRFDYLNSTPDEKVINKLKELKKEGHIIILFTSRGMRTFKGDIKKINAYHRPILNNWLAKYDVPYDELHFGKPWNHGNLYYVDDKSLTINQFLKSKDHTKCIEKNVRRN